MSGLVRALLLGLVALVVSAGTAGATMLWSQGGVGGGVVAKTCTGSDFFSGVDAAGNFTCSTPVGSGDITDVWGCTTGNCNAITGAAGDSFDAGSADASSPTTRSTTLPATCSEGQHHQDTDSGGTETYVCTAANTWTKLVAATDNVATATALAANPSDCGANTYATTIAASGNLTCSTVGFDQLGSGTNAAATMVVGTGSSLTTAGSGTINATRASTADALFTNPSDCSANQFATTIAANGNLTCAQPAFSDLSGSATDAQVPDTITLTNITQIGTRPHSSLTSLSADDHTQYALLAGRSTGQTLIGGTGASEGLTLQSTSNATRGTVTVKDKLLVGDDVPDQTTGILNVIAVTPSVDITGSAGMVNGYAFAPTTTMSGTLETVAGYRLDPSVTVTSSAPFIRGLYFGGTITNSYAPSPSALPVYQVNAASFNPTLTSSTANGGLYQDAYVDSAVIEYTGTGNVTTALNPWAPISFLSQPRFTTTNSGDLSIDQIFSLYSTPQIGTLNGSSSLNVTDMATVGFIPPAAYTGNISAAGSTITNYYGMYGNLTTALPSNLSITNAYGIRLTAWDKATNNYSLYSDSGAATLYNAGKADIGDDVADVSSGVTSIIDVSPTIDVSGGSLNGYVFAPTTTLSGILNYTSGITFSPTISHNVTTIGALVYGMNMVGTLTSTGSGALSTASILNHGTTYTSSTASAAPITNLIALNDVPTVSSSATSGTATPTSVIGMVHNPVISRTGVGGTMTLTSDIGLQMDGRYTESAGTLNVTNRIGLKYNDVTNTSSATAVTNNIGVDIAALSTATNNIGVRNADTTVYTPCTDDISGNTDYMVAKSQCTVINLTAGGARDFTAGTDQIADGYDGQIIYLFFSGANSVKFDDGDNVNLAAAGAMTLSAGDTLTLLFSSTRGEWLELARADN